MKWNSRFKFARFPGGWRNAEPGAPASENAKLANNARPAGNTPRARQPWR
jgi:hypothetical protein